MQIFITDWWLCPELYLRRPFSEHFSSRLDVLLEAKSKQGVQVPIGLVALILEIPFTLCFVLSIRFSIYEL